MKKIIEFQMKLLKISDQESIIKIMDLVNEFTILETNQYLSLIQNKNIKEESLNENVKEVPVDISYNACEPIIEVAMDNSSSSSSLTFSSVKKE